jgi:hypothetical protein
VSKRDKKLDDVSRIQAERQPKIVHSDDGGALRRIINGRNVMATGQVPSFKAKRSLPEQADHEVGLLHHCDADPAVGSCVSQPHRVVIPVPWDTKPLIYIPDLRRDLADGRIEIFETKKENDSRLADEQYQFKLSAVKLLYEREGWSFRVLTEKQILATQLYRNCEEMSRFAFAKIHPATIYSLENQIDKAGGALPFARAAEIVPHGRPILLAMMIRRHITFDIRVNILPDAPVSRVNHVAIAMRSDPFL